LSLITIISSLGFTSAENFRNIENGKIGITERVDNSISASSFYASLVDNEELDKKVSALDNPSGFTKAEKLAICSVNDALNISGLDYHSPRTLFYLSTTKGNVELLAEKNNSSKRKQHGTAHQTDSQAAKSVKMINYISGILQDWYHPSRNDHQPIVISNACISGLLAIITGARLLRSGAYDNVIVTGLT
jgi:3-oxoacyl-[acyl-carrier-protein] synthase-1